MLAPLADEYDYVFLDCPPSISLASESVFEAADALLIPLLPAALSARTLDQIEDVAGAGARRLAFFSMADSRKRMHRDVMARSRRAPRDAPHHRPVRRRRRADGQARAPLEEFVPRGGAAVAFRELWKEIQERLGTAGGTAGGATGQPD